MTSDNQFVKTLIESVRKNQCIYLKSDSHYTNKDIKDKAWLQVSTDCQRSERECRSRWKSLREKFGRELKRNQYQSQNSSGHCKDWPYFQDLLYLKNSIIPRNRNGSKDTTNLSPVELFVAKEENEFSSNEETIAFNEDTEAESEIANNESDLILNLIEAVRKQECLYMKTHKHYGNKLENDKAWQLVAYECHSTEIECEIRWRLLREKFLKELKKTIQRPNLIVRKWPYFNDLLYLKDSILPRSSSKEFQRNDDDMFNDDTQYNSWQNNSTQSKLNETLNKIDNLLENSKNQNQNGLTNITTRDELFMRTMLELMKELPLSARDEFQAKMFQEIYKLRAQHICRDS